MTVTLLCVAAVGTYNTVSFRPPVHLNMTTSAYDLAALDGFPPEIRLGFDDVPTQLPTHELNHNNSESCSCLGDKWNMTPYIGHNFYDF